MNGSGFYASKRPSAGERLGKLLAVLAGLVVGLGAVYFFLNRAGGAGDVEEPPAPLVETSSSVGVEAGAGEEEKEEGPSNPLHDRIRAMMASNPMVALSEVNRLNIQDRELLDEVVAAAAKLRGTVGLWRDNYRTQRTVIRVYESSGTPYADWFLTGPNFIRRPLRIVPDPGGNGWHLVYDEARQDQLRITTTGELSTWDVDGQISRGQKLYFKFPGGWPTAAP